MYQILQLKCIESAVLFTNEGGLSDDWSELLMLPNNFWMGESLFKGTVEIICILIAGALADGHSRNGWMIC